MALIGSAEPKPAVVAPSASERERGFGFLWAVDLRRVRLFSILLPAGPRAMVGGLSEQANALGLLSLEELRALGAINGLSGGTLCSGLSCGRIEYLSGKGPDTQLWKARLGWAKRDTVRGRSRSYRHGTVR